MRHPLSRPLLALAACAALLLTGCGDDGPAAEDAAPVPSSTSLTSPTSPTPEAPATSGAAPSGQESSDAAATAGGDPEFCAVAADDTLDTAQPGTQEYADGTAALADAAPPELTEAAETLRTLGQVQLDLGPDGTAEELEAAMTERGIDAPTLLGAFAAVGRYIDTCDG